ncbi:retrovirus-related pol polyprotein from transposon TNT 1-94 [Tanacetum coccineum]
MLIIPTISEAYFRHVQGTTSCDLWLSFEKAYAPHSTSREYTLKTQLLRIEMHVDETPDAYLNHAQEYVDALAAIDEPLAAQLSAPRFQVSPFAPSEPQAFYGARPLNNNNRSNNNNNHGNRNNSRGNKNNRGRDTEANSHVTPDLKAIDNSEAYYSDDTLHVSNGKGLPILHISSSKVYSPQKMLKRDKNGAITRYKARFVTKGFWQQLGNNKGTIDNIICQLGFAFTLKDLGPLNYFLDIEIVPDVFGILLSHKKYILELLQRVGLSNCNHVSSLMVTSSSLSLDDSTTFSNLVKYRQVVGSLQYVTLSRPDIAFAVNKVCQYMHAPTNNHWSEVKWILRYFHGTVEHGMLIHRSFYSTLQAFTDVLWKGNSDTSLEAFSDADWAED